LPEVERWRALECGDELVLSESRLLTPRREDRRERTGGVMPGELAGLEGHASLGGVGEQRVVGEDTGVLSTDDAR
jgi:hypothetical protein